MNLHQFRKLLAIFRLQGAVDVFRAMPIFQPKRRRNTASDQPRASQFVDLSFANEAGTRAYKLFIPSGYHDVPCPLIVMLHGCNQSPDDFALGTGMNALAEIHTFLAAYPAQSVSANLQKCWNWYEPRDQQRERGEPSLVAGITAQIIQNYAVDQQRVYVAGMSAGGAAASVLGAAYPEVYAAVGVHSGVACGLAEGMLSGLLLMETGYVIGHPHRSPQTGTHSDRIPTIVFQGDYDTTVNPRNLEHFATAAHSAECTKRIETGQVPHGHAFTQTTYSDARGNNVLEEWDVHGMGHEWSGGSKAGSYTDSLGPDASRAFVRFFLAHRHPNRVDEAEPHSAVATGNRGLFGFLKSPAATRKK